MIKLSLFKFGCYLFKNIKRCNNTKNIITNQREQKNKETTYLITQDVPIRQYFRKTFYST